MNENKEIQAEKIVDDLEGRVAGVLTRFFKDKKDLLGQVAESQKVSVDGEIVELTLATNALIFQLASLVVMLHRKTGGTIEDLVKIESQLLKNLVPIVKKIRDESDSLQSKWN